jgi:glycosyltransferase involved in cell wall biosynthesis
MTPAYPRVLVLAGDEITADFSTGITVVNLFKGWPRDRVAQICLIPSTGNAERLSGVSQALPANGGVFDIPIRWGLRRVRAVRTTIHGRPSPGVSEGAPAARSFGSLAALLELGPVRLGPDAKAMARAFGPDIIYAPMSGIRMMRLARSLSRLTGAPVVPHLLDDWPTTLFEGLPISGLARRTMLDELSLTLDEAPAIGVVSQAMADEYEQRYGISAEPLMNCVDSLGQPKEVTRPTNPVRFAYVGGLHLGRASLLLSVARAVEGTPGAELWVHAPDEDLQRHRELFRGLPSLHWGPSLPSNEVGSALTFADVLVHLESFDEDTARYTRLSISTKIPQYLAAARPVLALGPAGLASMTHLISSGGAIAVDTASKEALETAVRTIATDPFTRARLASNAVSFASKHHHAPAVREQFRTLLAEVPE